MLNVVYRLYNHGHVYISTNVMKTKTFVTSIFIN